MSVFNLEIKKDSQLPYLALLIGMFAISASAILIRHSTSEPLVIGSYRQAFATLIFLPFIMKDKGSELRSQSYSTHMEMILAGILLGTHFSFFITSVKETSVAASVLLATCHVVYVSILGWFFFGEMLSKKAIIGTSISLGGIVILFGGDLLDNPGNFTGNFFAFISGILAGLYYLSGRKLRKTVSLPTYAFVVYLFSFLTMFSIVLIQNLTYQNLSLSEIQLFLLMALIPTLLGHTMQNWALGYLPAYIVSISLLAEPIGSGLLAWLFFQEVPSFGVILGGLIVLFGLYVVILAEESG
ncbi:MAG: DMT family transporter [Candidatus Poseidoniia archaeon]|nr:DMT family transporter [Candidatus Poseidoniia archaeon]